MKPGQLFVFINRTSLVNMHS